MTIHWTEKEWEDYLAKVNKTKPVEPKPIAKLKPTEPAFYLPPMPEMPPLKLSKIKPVARWRVWGSRLVIALIVIIGLIALAQVMEETHLTAIVNNARQFESK